MFLIFFPFSDYKKKNCKKSLEMRTVILIWEVYFFMLND